MSMALAKLGVEFEPQNPVTAIMVDTKTGKINGDILDEKALSAIIEFTVDNDGLKEALKTVKDVSTQINTVFSVGLISRVSGDGTIPTVAIAKDAGFSPRLNTKTNVGLGKPLIEEA